MQEYKEKLIKIYSNCRTGDLKNNKDYNNLCNEYNNRTTFIRFASKLMDIKECIEMSIIDIQEKEQGQVSEALVLICSIDNNGDKEMTKCYKLLIKTIFYKSWSDDQVKYFEDKSIQLTQTTYDYFLSFTNRNNSPGEINAINHIYKDFIVDMLGEHNYLTNEVINNNLLAKSIKKYLADQNYNGFYYPDKIGDCRNVNEKVENACKSAFIFIQLVQNIMLKKPDADNFCFKEYKWALEVFDKKCRKYVLAERSHNCMLGRCDVCLDYYNWFDEIGAVDKIILDYELDYKIDISKIKNIIQTKLCDVIREYKQSLIDEAPN